MSMMKISLAWLEKLKSRKIFGACVLSLRYDGKDLQTGLMVSALDSGLSGPGSGPGWGHCVVFLGKTPYSHGASLHPGV